jgi:hypothetical protein
MDGGEVSNRATKESLVPRYAFPQRKRRAGLGYRNLVHENCSIFAFLFVWAMMQSPFRYAPIFFLSLPKCYASSAPFDCTVSVSL